MLKYRFLALLFSLFLSFNLGWAQPISIYSRLDSTHIVIGDHLKMHLTITTDLAKKITVQDAQTWKLMNCEVVEVSPLVQAVSKGKNVYSQIITLTSFDAGAASVCPISILGNDSLVLGVTDSIHFNVDTLPVFVDTAQLFKDIKLPLQGEKIAVVAPAKDFSKIQKIVAIIFGSLLLLAVGGFFIWKYVMKFLKEKKLQEDKNRRKENAASLALTDLNELKKKKLWQNGFVKDYYSELSMVLRTYIDNQWDINAKEMVTSQIIDEITSLDITDDQLKELHRIFTMSDLAKYAKEQPIGEDNETNLKNAYRFVKSTDSNEKRKKAEEIQQKHYKNKK
ncbi:MAG TPA: hypothetical protein PKK66_06110 [Bacteroidales bacterium]|nr:hypothetical protein [Bacteroidales bacterium]HPT52961.1 hypothetical protein [Bacteroidales bacterium]